MAADPGGPAAGRTAFLLFGHALTPRFLQQIADARHDLEGRADVHVIGWFEGGAAVPGHFLTDPSFHAYGPDRMAALGYPVKGGDPFQLMPGNCDMLVIAFAQDHPGYDTIWQFENDAVFTGPLGALLDAFAGSDSALLCTHVVPVSPDWFFRDSMGLPDGWPSLPGTAIRVFLPIFRVSRRMLLELDRFYRDGGTGHHEATWPYVATACGMKMEDVGGTGPYVRPGNRNRFYSGKPFSLGINFGTFRWRPAMQRPGRRPLTLWHPVKEQYEPLHWRIRQRYRVLVRLVLPRKIGPQTRERSTDAE